MKSKSSIVFRAVQWFQVRRKQRVTILLVAEPDRPPRRVRLTRLGWNAAFAGTACVAVIAIAALVALSVQAGHLRRQQAAVARLEQERHVLAEERETQGVRLAEYAVQIRRLQQDLDEMRAVRREIEAILTGAASDAGSGSGASSAAVSVAATGAAGGNVPTGQLADWTERALDQTHEELRALASSMKNLHAQVIAFDHKQQHTPSLWPVTGRVTSNHGSRVHPITGVRGTHDGIDVAAPMGTPVRAAAAGRVSFAGNHGGYGLTVVIDHGYGLATRYAHLSRSGVKLGNVVNKGDVIAFVGTSGLSTGPHLHYEVLKNGTPVNPRGYLPN